MVLEKSPFPEGFLGVDLQLPKSNLYPHPLLDGGAAFGGIGGDAWPEDHPGTGGPLGLGWQRITSNTAAVLGTGTFGNVQSWGVPVTPGEPYTASLYTWSSHTDTRGIRIFWMDETGGGVALRTDTSWASFPINTWQRHHITATPPAGAGFARVVGIISPASAWPASWVIGFANAMIERGDVLRDWHAGTILTWQPLGDDLDQAGVTLSHGVRSEGSSADVSALSFAVTNPEGKYSPRNPRSPLYGLVGRNTPARARAALGAPWLDLEAPGARAATPDVAALDITGDIDIRWWGERDSWHTAADLLSKWSSTGNQRSWLLRAEADGTLTLFWSTDGTAFLEARSDAPVPAWAGEIALRVTLDVNNGAGGRTARFYYKAGGALSGAGVEWTPLGSDRTASGTTSIYNSSAALTVGKEPTSSAATPPQQVYGWQVRNGIDGTVVSSIDIHNRSAGDTAFTDYQGRTWTVTNGSITNTHTLAVCEVSEWPVDWDTKGAESVMTTIRAAGPRRRLGQGAQPVESVLYRAITNVSDTSVKGYWPMEDGSDATVLAAAIGSRAARFGVNVRPAAYEDLPGSGPAPTLGRSSIRATPDVRPGTGEIQVRWLQHMPPAAVGVETTLLRIELAGGTISRIDLRIRPDGLTGIFGYDQNDAQLAGSTFIAIDSPFDTTSRYSVEINQNGSNVFWRRSRLEPGQDTGVTYGQNFTNPQTLGRVRSVRFNPQLADFGETAVGHLTVGTEITPLFDGIEADILTGYLGEAAGARMSRLAAENGESLTLRGRDSADMGEQQEETLLDLLAEAAAADGGIFHDDSRALQLRYRTLHSMGSQPPVTIPYSDNLVIPFDTTDDDGLTRNRVSVSRPAGSKITHELTEGPMSTQPPPAGVGVYDQSLTLNLFDDDLVDRTGSWQLHVGTWDEGRYPTIGVDLAHPFFLGNPVLTRQLLALRPGDRLVITDPPPWLPPRSVDVIVQGTQVEITPLHMLLQWSCVPARPYHVAYWNAGHRWSGQGTALAATVTSSAVQLPLSLPDGVTWTHADGDYDIAVGGEVMTVTGIAGDVMTVTRSVNGVVKSHAAGTAVELANPSFYAR